jgi:hypothetical protein
MGEDLFQKLLNRPFRWPRKGDEPLRKAPDARHRAEIAERASDRMVFLAAGFMRTGRLLVDTALADPRLRWELTLPTLYNYRHAIELGLKWTLITYGRAFDVDCPDVYTTHSLKVLWDAFQRLLDAISQPEEQEANRAAERVVMAFHEWDKQGDTFRYAMRRDGGPILLRDHHIDLVQLRDVMEGFENFLGGVDGALDAARSEVPW